VGWDDWPYVNHDTYGTRYSPLYAIDTRNVNRLQRACTYTFPNKEASQTAPMCGHAAGVETSVNKGQRASAGGKPKRRPVGELF